MFLLRPFPPKGEHEEESSTRSVGERSGEGTPAATERDADANVFFLEGEEREEAAGMGTTEAHNRFQRPYHGRENRHAESEEQEGEAHFC